MFTSISVVILITLFVYDFRNFLTFTFIIQLVIIRLFIEITFFPVVIFVFIIFMSKIYLIKTSEKIQHRRYLQKLITNLRENNAMYLTP